jgi:hypothetical protein
MQEDIAALNGDLIVMLNEAAELPPEQAIHTISGVLGRLAQDHPTLTLTAVSWAHLAAEIRTSKAA